MQRPQNILTIALAGLLLALVGCEASLARSDVISDLQHVDAVLRADAALRAGQMDPASPAAREVLPHLVDRLSDTAPEVRMTAIVSLERLTGQRMDYSPYASPADRQEAIDRWRQRLRQTTLPAPKAPEPDKDVSDAPQQ